MDTPSTVETLVQEFAAAGDPERAVNEKKYLKSALSFHGMTVPQLRTLVRSFRREHDDATHADLVELCRALWKLPWHEPRLFSVLLLQADARRAQVEDLPVIEGFLRDSHSWVYVDGLAGWTVGPLAARKPAVLRTLDAWSTDPDFWVRRAAMLALVASMKEDAKVFARFERYAVPQLGEKEFFIRKAIGWVLRDMARVHPEKVVAFVEKHGAEMAGLTLREAVRQLPEKEKKRLLARVTSGR